MDYANPTEIWWPHPSAFDDLSVQVVETEDGGSEIILDAPDGSECGDWLSYFNETPERQVVFHREFMRTLQEHLNRVQQANGQTEGIPDEQATSGVSGQEDQPGSVKEHKPRRNRKKRTEEEVSGTGELKEPTPKKTRTRRVKTTTTPTVPNEAPSTSDDSSPVKRRRRKRSGNSELADA